MDTETLTTCEHPGDWLRPDGFCVRCGCQTAPHDRGALSQDIRGHEVETFRHAGEWFWQSPKRVPRDDPHGPFESRDAALADADLEFRPAPCATRDDHVYGNGSNGGLVCVLCGEAWNGECDHPADRRISYRSVAAPFGREGEEYCDACGERVES
jgi:hypothetical protein